MAETMLNRQSVDAFRNSNICQAITAVNVSEVSAIARSPNEGRFDFAEGTNLESLASIAEEDAKLANPDGDSVALRQSLRSSTADVLSDYATRVSERLRTLERFAPDRDKLQNELDSMRNSDIRPRRTF